jgi:hypothetical protein
VARKRVAEARRKVRGAGDGAGSVRRGRAHENLLSWARRVSTVLPNGSPVPNVSRHSRCARHGKSH